MSTITIPIGFEFRPAEEVLINKYLLNKTMGNSLPYNVILERDLYGSDPPWKILRDDDPWIKWENNKKCVYVFTRLKYVSKTSQNHIARTTSCGLWMGKSNAKLISDGKNGPIIGKKVTLVFESNDENFEGTKGHWSMHEYSLAGSNLNLVKSRIMDKIYVVCRIIKDESKLLKILPRRIRKNRIEKTETNNLEDNVATSGLKSEIKQNTQEWSSLSVPFFDIKDNGLQTQSCDKNPFNCRSYEEGIYGSDDMFDTSEILALIEEGEGNKFDYRNQTTIQKCSLSTKEKTETNKLEDDVAAAIIKENGCDFQKISQESSSLSAPFIDIEHDGFQTQSYYDNLFNCGSYEDGIFECSDMFDTSEILALIAADEGNKCEYSDQDITQKCSFSSSTQVDSSYFGDWFNISKKKTSFDTLVEQEQQRLNKRARIYDQEREDVQINKKMRFGDF